MKTLIRFFLLRKDRCELYFKKGVKKKKNSGKITKRNQKKKLQRIAMFSKMIIKNFFPYITISNVKFLSGTNILQQIFFFFFFFFEKTQSIRQSNLRHFGLVNFFCSFNPFLFPSPPFFSKNIPINETQFFGQEKEKTSCC